MDTNLNQYGKIHLHIYLFAICLINLADSKMPFMVILGIKGSEPNRMDQFTSYVVNIQVVQQLVVSSGDGNHSEPTNSGTTTIMRYTTG